MLLLITYDVNTTTPEGRKRLRKVAKICENYGQRVQNSVFECLVDQAQRLELCHELEKIIDTKSDSLRSVSYTHLRQEVLTLLTVMDESIPVGSRIS